MPATPIPPAAQLPQTSPTKTLNIASWSFIVLFATGSLLFLLLEIGYQYFFNRHSTFTEDIIYGAAFAGATLIASSLFSSAIFKWYPKYASRWRIRRYLGVAGALCISIHVYFVIFTLYGGDLGSLYYSWNPIDNPIIFGTIAYSILFAMLLTSTDWAMRVMGRKWKFLHRFVYIAFPASIFHWLLTNPHIYQDPPGGLLVGITALAVLGQLFWFFKTIKARHYRNAGTYVGFAITLAVLITAYFAFLR